jgi:hypothetical protein
MKPARTLIYRQDEALAALAQPRTSERRYRKYRASVLRRYRQSAARLGYTPDQIEAQVRDLLDMHALNEIEQSEFDRALVQFQHEHATREALRVPDSVIEEAFRV